MRRRILGLIGVVVVLTVVALVPAAGQDPTTARQEGKVVIYYGGGPQALLDAIKSAFERKYPEVTIEWVGGRGGVETIRQFLSEYEKGVKSADVVWLAQAGLFDILQKPDSLAKYVPKDTDWLSADLKDKNSRWASADTVLYVIGYNTNLVPQTEAPKGYRDLLDPKWRGKIGAANPKSAPGIPPIWKTMEKHLGEDFIRQLAGQKINYYANSAEAANKLVAGEISILLNAGTGPVESGKRAGNPVDWVRTSDNTYFSQPGWYGVSANAPHPHAARLFMDFIFSKEG